MTLKMPHRKTIRALDQAFANNSKRLALSAWETDDDATPPSAKKVRWEDFANGSQE